MTRRRAGPEDTYWSEEAGRRFAQQQEELVNLREENERLRRLLAEGEGLRYRAGLWSVAAASL